MLWHDGGDVLECLYGWCLIDPHRHWHWLVVRITRKGWIGRVDAGTSLALRSSTV